jgi:hypothetical protein
MMIWALVCSIRIKFYRCNAIIHPPHVPRCVSLRLNEWGKWLLPVASTEYPARCCSTFFPAPSLSYSYLQESGTLCRGRCIGL